ncbi:MAG TPA: hypothetical protein VFC92_02495 [Bacteroidales bacterium]|nr:hypothetical protein [Bacteroidales bacterium]
MAQGTNRGGGETERRRGKQEKIVFVNLCASASQRCNNEKPGLRDGFVFVVLPAFVGRAVTQPFGVNGRLLQAFTKTMIPKGRLADEKEVSL